MDKPQGELLTETVPVLLTRGEKAAIEARADRELRSTSAMARLLIRRGLRLPPIKVETDE